MNLHKAYDTVDWVRLLKILDIYGSGPHIRGLLAEFWELQEVVTRENGYRVPHFQATRWKTQGGIISPTLFNLSVDNVVRNWLALMVEDELVAYEGLRLAAGFVIHSLFHCQR